MLVIINLRQSFFEDTFVVFKVEQRLFFSYLQLNRLKFHFNLHEEHFWGNRYCDGNIARGNSDPVIIISITKITEGGYYNDHSGCRASGWAPPQNHKCFRNNYSANERPQSRLPWRQPLGSFHVASLFFNWCFLFLMKFCENLRNYLTNENKNLFFSTDSYDYHYYT